VGRDDEIFLTSRLPGICTANIRDLPTCYRGVYSTNKKGCLQWDNLFRRSRLGGRDDEILLTSPSSWLGGRDDEIF
jgi:hypothetical protein